MKLHMQQIDNFDNALKYYLSLEMAEPARKSAEFNRTFTNEKQKQI